MYDINEDGLTLENDSESKDGMKSKSDPELGDDQELSEIPLMEIRNHGFTFVFIISNINSDYSIHDIDDKELPIKYGGIVKLFSKEDYITNQKTEKDKQITEKSNQNSDDGYILILLTLSGIYKYHIKNKPLSKYLSETDFTQINPIERGLEIAEIVVKNIAYHAYFDEIIMLCFFCNDEMLLMYYKDEWAVCDVFGSLRDSDKLEDLEFIEKFKMIFPSNSFMVIDKENGEQDWKKDLNDSIQKLELDKYHNMLEPWSHIFSADLSHPQYCFYLDEKKEKLLLIGNHTIQVWYSQGPEEGPIKRSLEFIHVPLSHLSFPDTEILDKWREKKMKVIDIKYCIGKFKLNIQIEDTEGFLQIKQIKMEDEDDIINVARYACCALKYFSVYRVIEQAFDEEFKLKFYDTIEETRKIILRFIRLHPTEWRLLDIRFDLMSGISTIRTALSEYYPNNAVHNIGWMNTVVDIIPELYECSEKTNGKEN
ncbi:10660_t:CDS:2, partial [Racocetra persica]